ncbi:MAG: IclR family transcriptional regulator [Devosia sp.]
MDERPNTPDTAAAPRSVPAVTRAIAILRLLASSRGPLGLNVIASRLELVPSTCLHILRVLVAEELVTFDVDAKRYSLDAGLLTLARSYLRSSGFAQQVQPRLDEIVRRFPVTALATKILNLEHMVVVATARAQAAMHIAVELGSRQPALMSATGRCLAAFGNYPQQQIDARFEKLRWDEPPTRDVWLAEVEETRERGFAVDRGTYLRGVTVIAAPVLDLRGRMVHALVALAFSDDIAEADVLRVGKALLADAADLTVRD